MKDKYQKTIYACFIGYVVQAVVNNFVPLLFLTFEKTYGIPLRKITMLITLNFGIQLIVDLLSAGFVDKIGYRVSIVIAHAASALGLLGLVVLPNLLPDAYTGILLSVMIYAIGGRSDRSADQPDYGELPDRQQRKSDEPVTFVLLLGTCGSRTDFHLLL